MQLYNSEAIREKIADAYAQIDAYETLCKSENREPTAEEVTEIDGLIASIGNSGDDGKEVSGWQADLKRAERFEMIKAQAAQPSRKKGITPEQPEATVPQFAVPRRSHTVAFKGEKAAENAYACGQWFKAQMLGDDKAREWCNTHGVVAVQKGSDDVKGGALVPTPLENAIIDAMDIYGVTRALARQLTMTSATTDIPHRTGGLTVYAPGEGNAITLSDKSWKNTQLNAVKRATLTKISRELSDDAIISVMDDMAMEIGRAFGIQQDKELILGDGTSTYFGVNGLTQASNISTTGAGNLFSELTLANFHSVVGALPQKFHANASWLMSRAGYAESAERLIYAAGGNTTGTVAAGEGRGSSMIGGRQFLGYPVYFSDQMPAEANSAVAAYFGDFRYGVVLGERAGVEIQASDDYAFNEDVTTVRGCVRYDIVVTDASSTGAFSRLILAAS